VGDLNDEQEPASQSPPTPTKKRQSSKMRALEFAPESMEKILQAVKSPKSPKGTRWKKDRNSDVVISPPSPGRKGAVDEEPSPSPSPVFKKRGTLKEKISGTANNLKRVLSMSSKGPIPVVSPPEKMPSQEDVDNQFAAMIFQRGLQGQKNDLMQLPVESKWSMVQEHMADSTKLKPKKFKSAKDLVKLLKSDALQNISTVRVHLASQPIHFVVKFVVEKGPQYLLSGLMSVVGKPLKLASDQQVLLDFVTSIRSALQHEIGMEAIASGGGALAVVGCFDPGNDLSVRRSCVSIMRLLLASSVENCKAVLESWSAYRQIILETERTRFDHLVTAMQTGRLEKKMNSSRNITINDFILIL